MGGVEIDLYDLLRFRIILCVGEIASERDDEIGILQRFHAGLVAKDSVYADIERVVRLEEFLRAGGMHHGRVHLVAKGNDLFSRVASTDTGIDGDLARSIDQSGQFSHFRIAGAANRPGAVNLPVHLVVIGFGEHVAVDDYDCHPLLCKRGLCGLGHDATRLRRVRNIFAEMRMLLVNLLLIDFLRKVEATFSSCNIGCDENHGRAIAVAFVDAVNEVERAGAAGPGADRQFACHIGFAARRKGTRFLMAHTDPA